MVAAPSSETQEWTRQVTIVRASTESPTTVGLPPDHLLKVLRVTSTMDFDL